MAQPPIDQRREWKLDFTSPTSLLMALEFAAEGLATLGWSMIDIHDPNDNEGPTLTASSPDGYEGILLQSDINGNVVMVVVMDGKAESQVAIAEPWEGLPTPSQALHLLLIRGGLDLDVTPWWYQV